MGKGITLIKSELKQLKDILNQIDINELDIEKCLGMTDEIIFYSYINYITIKYSEKIIEIIKERHILVCELNNFLMWG